MSWLARWCLLWSSRDHDGHVLALAGAAASKLRDGGHGRGVEPAGDRGLIIPGIAAVRWDVWRHPRRTCASWRRGGKRADLYASALNANAASPSRVPARLVMTSTRRHVRAVQAHAAPVAYLFFASVAATAGARLDAPTWGCGDPRCASALQVEAEQRGHRGVFADATAAFRAGHRASLLFTSHTAAAGGASPDAVPNAARTREILLETERRFRRRRTRVGAGGRGPRICTESRGAAVQAARPGLVYASESFFRFGGGRQRRAAPILAANYASGRPVPAGHVTLS